MIFCGGFPVVFGSLCFFFSCVYFLGGSCGGSSLCLLLLVGLSDVSGSGGVWVLKIFFYGVF